MTALIAAVLIGSAFGFLCFVIVDAVRRRSR